MRPHFPPACVQQVKDIFPQIVEGSKPQWMEVSHTYIKEQPVITPWQLHLQLQRRLMVEAGKAAKELRLANEPLTMRIYVIGWKGPGCRCVSSFKHYCTDKVRKQCYENAL